LAIGNDALIAVRAFMDVMYKEIGTMAMMTIGFVRGARITRQVH
jgi:hypothetical protein